MGGRYYITGVQLGIIKSLIETECVIESKRLQGLKKLLNLIEDNQFIGNITEDDYQFRGKQK